MRRAAPLAAVPLLLVALAPGAAAGGGDGEPEPVRSAEAIAILERAAEALEAIESVRYTAIIRPGGIGETFWPAAEGTAVLAGWDATLRRPERFRFDLETRRAGAPGPAGVTAGGDGETFFVVDHGTRRAYEDIDPLVLGAHGQTLARFEMTEFVMAEPLRDEIGARRVELIGTELCAGRECYRIHVGYSGGRGEAEWLFATDDLLPRWRVQRFSIPQGEGWLEISILDLELDPPLDPGRFELELPAGYRQIDDFAP